MIAIRLQRNLLSTALAFQFGLGIFTVHRFLRIQCTFYKRYSIWLCKWNIEYLNINFKMIYSINFTDSKFQSCAKTKPLIGLLIWIDKKVKLKTKGIFIALSIRCKWNIWPLCYELKFTVKFLSSQPKLWETLYYYYFVRS